MAKYYVSPDMLNPMFKVLHDDECGEIIFHPTSCSCRESIRSQFVVAVMMHHLVCADNHTICGVNIKRQWWWVMCVSTSRKSLILLRSFEDTKSVQFSCIVSVQISTANYHQETLSIYKKRDTVDTCIQWYSNAVESVLTEVYRWFSSRCGHLRKLCSKQ